MRPQAPAVLGSAMARRLAAGMLMNTRRASFILARASGFSVRPWWRRCALQSRTAAYPYSRLRASYAAIASSSGTSPTAARERLPVKSCASRKAVFAPRPAVGGMLRMASPGRVTVLGRQASGWWRCGAL